MKKLLVGVGIALGIVLGGSAFALSKYHTVAPKTAPTPLLNVNNALKTLPPPNVDDLLRLTNAERAKAGVAPLKLDTRLNQSAQMKADEIARTGVFEHVGTDGRHGYEYIKDTGLSCTSASENLEAGNSSEEAISEWMASTLGHREAILNPNYDLVGFGISQGPAYKNVVQHFCNLP